MHKNAQTQEKDFIQENETLKWELAALRAERDALRERVMELKAACKWLKHIYVNATSDDAGEDFRFYFEPDEILAIRRHLERR